MEHVRTTVVETSHGPIQGFVDAGMQQFLGIPYAAPPVGALRWHPPVPPDRWGKPRDATSFGPVAAQSSTCFPGFGHSSSNEDCLYLNVFTPSTHKYNLPEKLPVMVWIHGGGFACGASNDYNPSSIVDDGHVVFVSVNYRVSLFGFFSHPAINGEGHSSGNYGIMDQQFALTWVQQNIANFGGDAANVTLFGESAGGACTLAHISAPSSRGLFQKAIIQSGGSPPTLLFPAIEKLEGLGKALASAAGCPESEQTSNRLRQLSTEALLAADEVPDGEFGIGKFPFGLMEDGIIVPKDLRVRFSTGDFNHIPILIGVNKDEFTWFQAMLELRSGRMVTAEGYPETVAGTLDLLNKLHLNGVIVPDNAIPTVLEMYPVEAHGSPSRALAAIVGDSGLISTAGRRTVRVLAKFAPVLYAYEFDVPDTPCPWPEVSFSYGSGHTLELPYIFPGFRGASGKATPLSRAQQKLATQMVQYWTAFAASGTPDSAVDDKEAHKGLTGNENHSKWVAYNAEEDNIMLFQAAEPSKMIDGWGHRHNSDFWDTFYPTQL